MTRYLLALLLISTSISSCTTLPLPTPEPVPSAAPNTSTGGPNTTTPTPYITAIQAIGGNSFCARYEFEHEQGQGPNAFFQGMALAYAKEVCHPNPRVGKPLADVSEDVRDQTDAISWLNSVFVSRGIDKSPMPRKVYNLMIGSAMQETSGRYCIGRDPGADNTSAESAEAGLFQTSYDSQDPAAAKGERAELLKVLNAPTKFCAKDVFAKNVTCSSVNAINYGSGPGMEFQKRSKECPMFAADYHAVMVRVERKHYGPINGRYALPNAACDKMLAQVEQYVKANPEVCGVL